MARKMGAIPFLSKYLQKRRFGKLEKRASKLKEKFCDLSEDIEKEKGKAADIFTKSEYEKVTDRLDENLSKVQDCALTAEETPAGAGAEKDCRKIAARKMGRKDARGLKKGSPEYAKWERLTRDCVEKGGGETV